MVIFQGDVFWADLDESSGAGPGYRRPAVVIQNDIFNHSPIDTVVICMLTTNLALAESPGNVLLAEGEANLPKRSVVNVSQIFTLDKRDLLEKIGSLSSRNLERVLVGVYQIFEPA